MKKILYIALGVFSLFTDSRALPVDFQASGGLFEDCELIDLGPQGAISGTAALGELTPGGKWASALAFILTDDSKFQTSFRLSIGSVTTSPRLEVRYEFFAGSRRPVAEGLGELAIGANMPFRLSWQKDGRVEISAGPAQTRNLLLDFRPTRAFILVSGGRGRMELNGVTKIDCSRDLSTPPEKR